MNEYNEMVKALAKPGQNIINDLTPESAHNLHMVVGITGEVGELFEAIRDGDDNIVEELGDIEFFFEGLQQGINFEIDDDHVDLTYRGWGLQPLMEALSIEAGNILDVVKKQAIYAKTLDVEKLTGLMLDFRGVLNAVYYHSEIRCTPFMAKCANIQKLSERYAGLKYSNEAAQIRADKVSTQ